jgi:hypothetical protein
MGCHLDAAEQINVKPVAQREHPPRRRIENRVKTQRAIFQAERTESDVREVDGDVAWAAERVWIVEGGGAEVLACAGAAGRLDLEGCFGG